MHVLLVELFIDNLLYLPNNLYDLPTNLHGSRSRQPMDPTYCSQVDCRRKGEQKRITRTAGAGGAVGTRWRQRRTHIAE